MVKHLSRQAVVIGAAMLFTGFAVAQANAQRAHDWDWDGNYHRLVRINPGTFITVRTTQPINLDRWAERRFAGVVDQDVWDNYRRLSVPAIPRGSRVDLVVRRAPDGDLLLDLDSIDAHGVRYAVNAVPARIETDGRGRSRGDTAAYAGGGALLGTIIGAIAGGGKGAAIGAAAGAATGLGLSYRGRSIRVPAGSRLTFRLDEGLTMRPATRGTSGTYPPRHRDH